LDVLGIFFMVEKETQMTLTEQAKQDAQAVIDAQHFLSQVTAQASESAQRLATMQPSVALLDEILNTASTLDPAVSAVINGSLAQLKALLNV
jgi:ABC-type phosphate transport system ATPase subunit